MPGLAVFARSRRPRLSSFLCDVVAGLQDRHARRDLSKSRGWRATTSPGPPDSSTVRVGRAAKTEASNRALTRLGRMHRALRGGQRAGAVELIVEDDGPGIPTEVCARLFAPFFSGH